MEVVMKVSVIEKSPIVVQQKKRGARLLSLAILFFTAGFIAPLSGLIFMIVRSLLQNDTFFACAGTILLILSFPLLFVGSHFLDVEREQRKELKRRELL